MNEYYKKIDKSFFYYGLTIPKDYINMFIFNNDISLGSSREVRLIFNNNRYNIKINHTNRKSSTDVYQLRWDSNLELLSELRKEFIQSYFAIESQNFQAKIDEKYFITNLLGGNQEVVIFKPKDITNIELIPFIQIKTPYDNIFKKLVDENVFGWLSKVDNDQMITKSTKWFDISELAKHEDTNYVVYYLLDELNKRLYIGSAKKLSDRIKPGRAEIPNWNKFRYEIVHPKFHSLLREIEYHSILSFSRFLKNEGRLSNIPISDFTLVNKDYKFYRNK